MSEECNQFADLARITYQSLQIPVYVDVRRMWCRLCGELTTHCFVRKHKKVRVYKCQRCGNTWEV